MTSEQIRREFLDFFKSKGHKIIPSAPIVVKDDPTLMFNNAGMNPFKDIFLANKKPVNVRVADTQKCLRVSGKHNDLGQVGKDTYHHTMFEMLGNWSFGDYFKKEAIQWAWQLLTEVYKIDKNSLYVTIFQGDEEDDLPLDKEAYNCWKELVPEDRIIKGSKKDNFWEMGSSGPCGPCSEIHIDIRTREEKKKISGKEFVNKDHAQVIEIWNLVFMEFNRKSDGNLEKLAQKHVDTGMGFERLCMVLQGVQSNYDTDVFIPIIDEISKITGFKYGQNRQVDIAIRVVSDHLRAVCFAIADGQLPSNNGAGYVIRRILRRAVRYGFTFLHQKQAFIYRLVEVLAVQMGQVFPEITIQKTLVTNLIKEEEKSFLKTLEQGLIRIEQIIKETTHRQVSGVKAFELYDTFGFPLDLTSLILEENGKVLNQKEFNTEMQKQKNRSKEVSTVQTDDWVVLQKDNKEEFVGYDYLTAEVKITKYRKVVSKKLQQYQLVFNYTPFYAQSGGQIGDTGYIQSIREKIDILDTKKENELIVHIVKELPKDVNADFQAVVDKDKRKRVMANHSATHILHQILRQILGKHVEQRGSLVSDRYLRFDFSHFGKITDDEIKQVEFAVNEKIRQNIPLEENRQIPLNIAKQQGAMAMFGEKYADVVRVIKFDTSIELCGGTHVKRTGDIFLFKILSEGAISSGVRRIEAITSELAAAFFNDKFEILEQIKKKLKKPKDVVKAVCTLQKENRELKKQIDQLIKEKIQSIKRELLSNVEQIGEVNLVRSKLKLNADAIKNLAFQLKNEMGNLFLLLAGDNDQKPTITLLISEELAKRRNWNASNIVQELAKEIQGGGGGQFFFATAGGKNNRGLDKVLRSVKNYISLK